ncbi:MAG: DNA internalization-related competence protein ComEC/Rec2 [Candidatus Gastranaerophilales bacterium]|nr:DNA internalization-related competence protein ComEC/Rec2 [Candidatus Gastranaerophilales bacterium]
MNLHKTHITLIVCSLFTGGISSVFLNLTLWYFAFCMLITLFFLYKKQITYKLAFVFLITLIFSILYTYIRTPEPDYFTNIAPIKTSIRGIILSQPKIDPAYKAKFELEVSSVKDKSDWVPVHTKTLVSLYDKKGKFQKISQGDFIEIKGQIKPPYKATNPGQFDYGQYLRNSRIFTLTSASVKALKYVEHPKSGFWFFIQKSNEFRNRILEVHSRFIKSPKLEVLGGIVFGNYAIPTPKDIKQNFINSGLLHLLAASGMNVALVSGIWLYLATRLRVPYKISIIIAAMLVIIYATLTGFSPSVTRAVWMIEFILLGKLLDRKADNIALLALVCTIMLLFDPLTITNIGFQLSFIVTFGLLFCVPVFIEKTKPVPEFISGTILIPTIAQMWATPFQLFHFNNFSVYSVFANILVTPFIGVISFLGFISSLFSIIPIVGEKICWLLDKGTEPFISLLLYVSGYISALPGALQYFATPEIITILIFYSLILAVTLLIKFDFLKKRLNFTILSLLTVFILLIFSDNFSKDLKLTFFDVKEADSILIQTPDKKSFLVDTGNTGIKAFNSAKTIIVPYLRDKGINKLDALILTHPDSDHIGGTVNLLENIKVEKIIDNGESSKSKTYRKIQNIITKKHMSIKHVINNEVLYNKNNLKILLFRTNNKDSKTSNERSLIVFIKYGKTSALLMGDAESNSLNLIKKFVKQPVDIIKVGHHGSYNSINEDFIKYIKPQTAIISVGKNDYGHPTSKILNILRNHHVRTLRTDRDNAINIETNDSNINIQTFKSGHS